MCRVIDYVESVLHTHSYSVSQAEVFTGPLSSEEPRPDPGHELGQVQILLSLIGSGRVLFYCHWSLVCMSICSVPELIQMGPTVYGIMWYVAITAGENGVFLGDRENVNCKMKRKMEGFFVDMRNKFKEKEYKEVILFLP